MNSGPVRGFPPPRTRTALEAALPAYLKKQRWFGGKARPLDHVSIADSIPLPGPRPAALLLVDVRYHDGAADTQLLCAAAGATNTEFPAMLADSVDGPLHDGLAEPWVRDGLFRLVLEGRTLPGEHGVVRGEPAPSLLAAHGPEGLPAGSLLGKSEQSNTSIVFDRRWIMKLYRRLEPGVNPELEMCRALTSRTAFTQLPSLGGALVYLPGDGEPRTLAILQGFIPNRGDAWAYSLAEAGRFLDAPPEEEVRILAPYLASARLLGRRVAELHLSLSRIDDDPDFRPEPLTPENRRSLRDSMLERARGSLRLLRARSQALPAGIGPEAAAVIAAEGELLPRFAAVLESGAGSIRIRLHGDLHLGQVLHTGSDFCIIDFEGEPARPLSERRAKSSPLRDVAGMLRSFDYAACTALLERSAAAPEHAALEPRSRIWAAASGREFLNAYLESVSGTSLLPEDSDALLEAFLLDKAFYELSYELNNRPAWVLVPLRGILDVLRSGRRIERR